ncbi:hypothetical protein [Phytobacter sp. AG2a]
MSQEKKWVFTELVKNPDNLQQLLSYAIYKRFKDEIARTSRNGGKSEEDIEKDLNNYHEQCLNSPQTLNTFREKASATLEGYVNDVISQLRTSLSAELAKQDEENKKIINKLQGDIKAAERTAFKSFTEGAKRHAKKVEEPKGVEWWKDKAWIFIKFLFSGLPKFVATTVSMGFLVAVVTFASGDANNLVRTGLTKMVDLIAPAKTQTTESTQTGDSQNHMDPSQNNN